MSPEMPKYNLFEITCIAADAQNRPQYIARGGAYKRDNQKLCISPQVFDSVCDMLQNGKRQIFLADEEPNQPLTSFNLYTTDESEVIRLVLDRYFEIETATCIMVKQLIQWNPGVQIP